MSRSTHTLSNGQEIWIQSCTGTVLSESKTSTTSVHQDAPNRHLNQTSIGVIATSSPGQIYSTTHEDRDVWIRDSEGKDIQVSLTNFDIGIRSGHTITIIWGSISGRDSGNYFGAINHSTDKSECDVQKILGYHIETLWGLDIGRSSRGKGAGKYGAITGFALIFLSNVLMHQPFFSCILWGALVGAPIGMLVFLFYVKVLTNSIGFRTGPMIDNFLKLTYEISMFGKDRLLAA